MIDRKLCHLNKKLYRGHPVLSRCRGEDVVALNTDHLEFGGIFVSPQHSNTPQGNVTALNIVDLESNVPTPYQCLNSSRERVMIVKMTDDRPAGSIVTVRTPDGIARNVSNAKMLNLYISINLIQLK